VAALLAEHGAGVVVNGRDADAASEALNAFPERQRFPALLPILTSPTL
jgi:hypothetical protein